MPEEPLVEPKPGPLKFDEQVMHELHEAFEAVAMRHPEVKTMAAVISWDGHLNDAGCLSSVWIDRDGKPVTSLDGLFGSLHQTAALFRFQLDRAVQLQINLKDNIRVLGDHAKRLHEQNKKEQSEPNPAEQRSPGDHPEATQ